MRKQFNLVIFGATGRIGSLMVNQALAQGHMVTAFMRTPAKLAAAGVQIGHGRLRVIRGDVKDAELVAAAIRGQDAVICAVGSSKDAGQDLLTVLAGNLIAAMKRQQVGRIVCLAGAGVGDPQDRRTAGGLLLKGLGFLIGRGGNGDPQRQAELLRASDLAWTLVRPQRLIDGKKLGQYRTGSLSPGLHLQIARADVADFMLKLATEGGFEQQAPMVSY